VSWKKKKKKDETVARKKHPFPSVLLIGGMIEGKIKKAFCDWTHGSNEKGGGGGRGVLGVGKGNQ